MSLLADCWLLLRHDWRQMFRPTTRIVRRTQELADRIDKNAKKRVHDHLAKGVAPPKGALRFRKPKKIGTTSRLGMSLLFGFFALVAAPAAFFGALGLSKVALPVNEPAALFGVGLVLFGIVLFGFLSALTLIADSLFLRGDLELLAVSPIDPRAPAIVRFFGIAFGATLLPLAITGALSLFLPFFGAWAWLRLVPIAIAAGLLAAALATAAARGLIAIAGPRRARSVVTTVSAFLGLAFFVAIQSNNLLRGPGREAGWLLTPLTKWALKLGPHDAILWPGRVVLGPDWIWLAFLGASLGAYALSTATFGRRLLAQALSPGLHKQARRGARKASKPFASGPLAAIMRKERRAMLRDPRVIAALITNVVYLSPVFIALLAGSNVSATRIHWVAGSASVAAVSSLSGRAIWLIAGGESAYDLIALAPLGDKAARWGKILSAATIALPFALVGAVLVAWLTDDFAVGALILAFATATAFGSARIAYANVKPVDLKAFRRLPRGSLLGSLAQGLFTGLMAAGAALAATGQWLLAPVFLGFGAAAFYVMTVDDKPKIGVIA